MNDYEALTQRLEECRRLMGRCVADSDRNGGSVDVAADLLDKAIAAWNRRAQPAAPADAAPSVAPEPVAWEGGEGWESLAWELCADENGEDACNELIWEGGPIPEPWGDRWMKYEGEAKRLIALVHKHAAHPPRAPLTDADIDRIFDKHAGSNDWRVKYLRTYREGFTAIVRDLEAAHGISAEGEKT